MKQQKTKDPKKEVSIYALCKRCGEKTFHRSYGSLETGITVYKGKCPGCNKTKILIPLSDWKGLGD